MVLDAAPTHRLRLRTTAGVILVVMRVQLLVDGLLVEATLPFPRPLLATGLTTLLLPLRLVALGAMQLLRQAAGKSSLPSPFLSNALSSGTTTRG